MVGGSLIYWLDVAMIMGVSSVFSYAWLYYKIQWHLAPGVRRRLFPRQLQSLALAGIVSNLCFLPILYIDVWTFPEDFDPVRWDDYSDSCKYAYGVFRTARCVSVLQELHIALTFLALAMHWARALPALNQAIPVVWLGGLLLGVLEYTLSVWSFDLELKTCAGRKHNKETDKEDLVSMCIISVCTVMSLLSFVCTLRRAAASSEPTLVRRKSYSRAAAYAAVTVISYSGVFGAYMHTQFFEIPIWYWPIASMLQASNGVLNTVAFFLQSQYDSTELIVHSQHPSSETSLSGQSERTPAECDAQDSAANSAFWHVDFGGVDVIDILSMPSSASTFSGGRSWRQRCHFLWL